MVKQICDIMLNALGLKESIQEIRETKREHDEYMEKHREKMQELEASAQYEQRRHEMEMAKIADSLKQIDLDHEKRMRELDEIKARWENGDKSIDDIHELLDMMREMRERN